MTLRYMPLVCAAVLAASPRVDADVAADARAHYDKGAVAYKLGKFADAISEFEQAFTLDPDPVYLFNLAQAHRANGQLREATFELHQYLSDPKAVVREPAEKMLAEIEAEQKAEVDKAAALDRSSEALGRANAEVTRLQGELSGARGELAAAHHTRLGTIRVGLESGGTLTYLIGEHTHDLGLASSVEVSKVVHRGRVVFDLGGLLAVVPIPYTGTDGVGRSVYHWQTLAAAAARIDFSKSVFGLGDLAAGVGTYSNLSAGNPFEPTTGTGQNSAGSFDARLELAVGYRISPAVEAVYGLFVSTATRASPFRDQLSGIVALSALTLGLHVLL